MAIIKTGSLVASISGNISGINFVANGAQKTVRRAKYGLKRGTAGQTNSQAQLRKIQLTWANLSQGQRNVWKNGAALHQSPNRLGVARPLTGYQLFLKQNLFRLAVGEAISLDNPAPYVSAPVSDVQANFRQDVMGQPLYQIWYTLPVAPVGRVILYARRTLTRRAISPRGALKLLRLDFIAQPGNDITNEFIEICGTPFEEETVWVGVRSWDLIGLPSPLVRNDGEVLP